MGYKTDQEKFWSGEFGNDYIKRNENEDLLTSNINFFVKSLKSARNINSCIEFGANIGMNIKALKILYPKVKFNAIEINEKASSLLEKVIPSENINKESILDFNSDRKWDLTLVKGVLIHINPDQLKETYQKIFNSSSRYILICEYYSRNPESLNYRGFTNKLYKRDFAGELLDSFQNLTLLDYGFVYHRDPKFPQDDISWFLLEKIQSK